MERRSPSDRNFRMMGPDGPVGKAYRLLAADGTVYESEIPGQLGGYRPKKIYGRLDCWSATRHLAKGGYAKHRVFFADVEAAVAAGYRPCGHCLREDYRIWKRDSIKTSDDPS